MQREMRVPLSKVWVPIVLIVGILLGIVLSGMPLPSRPGPGPRWGWRFETPDEVDVILSTVAIVLLVALLVVYARTYSETKARFALGLVGVLLALLLQSILTSPLVFGAFGATSGTAGTYLLIADVFKIGALTIFLHLSLE